MNQSESKQDIVIRIPASSLYAISPGQNNDDRDAWKLLFGDNPGDTFFDAGEIAYFADHPALLSRTMARDLVELQTHGPSYVRENMILWSMSPLIQPSRYYRLFAAMVPTCPVNFEVLVKLRDVVLGGHLSDFDMQFDAAREELAVFGLWLHLTNWTDPDDDYDDALPAKELRTASYDDYKKACEKLLFQTIKPTRAKIREVLKGDFGKTLATNTFTTYRQQMLRQCSTGSSAVRPPESAD